MANIFFKFWRIGSILLLTVVLLFCYASLPDSIAVGFNEAGDPANFINKQQFFYWSAGVIVGLNFLFGVLENALVKLDFRRLLGNSSWGRNPGSVRNFLKGWFSALLAFINTYLVFVLLGLYNINSHKEQKLDFNYNYLLILGVLILLLILMYLPYKLMATQAPDED
ncbi:MAG: hypothetical protein KF870_14880 [Leadbetterella sp.]|nr:hypothetical protein [Leadbetterella sp.]